MHERLVFTQRHQDKFKVIDATLSAIRCRLGQLNGAEFEGAIGKALKPLIELRETKAAGGDIASCLAFLPHGEEGPIVVSFSSSDGRWSRRSAAKRAAGGG